MVQCYQCEYDACHRASVQECTTTKFCFVSTGLEVHDDNEIIVHKRGCENLGFLCQFNANKDGKPRILDKHLKMECCSEEFCNNGSYPILASKSVAIISNDNLSSSQHDLYFICGAFALCLTFIAIFTLILKMCNRKKQNNIDNSNYLAAKAANDVEKEYNCDYKPDGKISGYSGVFGGEVTSGSGSGYLKLVQRTLAKQIELITCVGRGRYGDVWKGKLHGEYVAVKIFFSREEESWAREIEIYSTIILKNENILPFIGSDVTSVNSYTQMWLVTTYYPLGSLFDYLNLRTLSLEDMFSVMLSIISGISHLHTEVLGTQGKLAIAHRDIKSKNILMKTNRTCCIADFGLAVIGKPTTGSLNIGFNNRVGTKRYMAPEVLNNAPPENDFAFYTMADIYSLSLVFWEIIRRTESDFCSALPYNVPYQDMVPGDPSFDEMKLVVCEQNRRPEIPQEFQEGARNLTNIITETWSSNPKSRLSALRIKKSLTSIKRDMLAEKI